ncbi:MAG: hypothetical protein ABMA14_04310 [Hyphomonadaceae bacterium]
MALMIVEGVVEEVGPATPLASESGTTGASWTFVRFSRGKRKPTTLERVAADARVGARIAPGQAGRFAFYAHKGQLILCGYAGPDGIEITPAASDPAELAAEAARLPAKRKIFWGGLLCLTILGLVHGLGMIKAGRKTLSQHPVPRRPGDGQLKRALEGRWFWPF